MEQACNMFSMVVVPLYDTLGTEAVSYIINQSKVMYLHVRLVSIVLLDNLKMSLIVCRSWQICIGHVWSFSYKEPVWMSFCLCVSATAGMTTVVCDKAEKVKSLLDAVGENKSLTTIIVVADVSSELQQLAANANVELLSFQSMVVWTIAFAILLSSHSIVWSLCVISSC